MSTTHSARTYIELPTNNALCSANSEHSKSLIKCVRRIDIMPDPVAHLVQSRDMLWTTDVPRRHRDQLIFPQRNGLAAYNTKTGQYVDLDDGLKFRPSCITTGLGYIAAADLNGELKVINVYDNRQKKRKILWTQQCPTSLSLMYVCGEKKLLASKEDEHISVFSMPTLASEAAIPIDKPVSTFSISADGSKMVVLCADHVARLYSFRSPTVAEYMGNFKMPPGAVNTCVDWKDDTQFAVACDLGFVRAMDIRSNATSIHGFKAKGHSISSPSSAIRSLKYSKSGSVDLLAFVEDKSFLNIVDTRDYKEHQVIRMHEQGPELNTTGLCFSSDGTRIYVGLARAWIADLPVNLNNRRHFAAPPRILF